MLESVQKFGCRVISKKWNSDYPTLLTHLQSIAHSTESQKTTKTPNVLQNSNKHFQYSSILFHLSSFTLPRLHHNKALFNPLVKTTSFKCPFFVDVIPLWNSLPSNFVSSSSFKINVLLDHISLSPFGSVLLCNFVLVLVCVFVFWETLILALQLICQPICNLH